MASPASNVTMTDRVQSPVREAWRMFLRNHAAVAGLGVLCLILLMTLLGPFIYPVDPFELVWAPMTPPLEEPGLWLGTDYLGRDILAGIIHGGAPTLAVGASAAAITVLIGITVGAIAGYFGGRTDDLLMRVTEFFQVLPTLLFAMVLVTLFSPSLVTVAVAIGIVSWPPAARLTRGEFLRIRQLEYVAACRTIGGTDRRIMWMVILPNALPPLVVAATLAIGVAILFEAGLSFLGLSDPNVFSWGMMIGASREYFLDSWWAVAFPGLAICLTVLAVSLVGDGLNDALNPRLRER
ncbi:ABC transporter permease [Geminicoccaceae bacterium 1502E]|nr:ABC transporter permease [Geminicoccaceae bacterium 1502E]